MRMTPRRDRFVLWTLALGALALVACGTDPVGGGSGGSSAAPSVASAGGSSGATTGGAAGAAIAGAGGADSGVTTAPDAEAGETDAGISNQPGGPVAIDNVFNARHTGGLTTLSNLRVRDFFLIRSGHLGALDGATGCAQFGALSIKTVIDLRDAADAATTPDAACVTSSTAYYQADLPKILPPSAASYAQTLDATEPKLAAIFLQLATGTLPAVIHCVIGRDRASMVTALVLLSLGVPESQVIADFTSNQDATVTVDAAWLQPVLERVQAAGGIEPYLQSWGVAPQQLADLRAMALE